MIKHFLLVVLLFFTAFAVQASDRVIVLTTASMSTVSTKILDARPSRNYLIIQNRGATSIYVKFDAVHSGTEGIEIVAGGNWEPPIAPRNAIWVKAASATPSITYGEGAP